MGWWVRGRGFPASSGQRSGLWHRMAPQQRRTPNEPQTAVWARSLCFFLVPDASVPPRGNLQVGDGLGQDYSCLFCVIHGRRGLGRAEEDGRENLSGPPPLLTVSGHCSPVLGVMGVAHGTHEAKVMQVVRSGAKRVPRTSGRKESPGRRCCKWQGLSSFHTSRLCSSRS